MLRLHCDSRHFLVFCVLLVAGCRNSANLITDPDFEGLGQNRGLPDGWLLEVSSGTYRTAGTSNAHTGKTGLAITGSGGIAEVRTNSFSLSSGDAVECEVWTKAQASGASNTVVGLALMRSKRGDFVPIAPVAADTQWRKAHFICPSSHQGDPIPATLTFRSTGDVLVWVDSIAATIVGTSHEHFLPDGGFEHPNVDGTYLKWNINSDSKQPTAKSNSESPFQGKNCLRLEGKGGWCVYTSTIAIPTAGNRVLFQAVVRANEGRAHLKLEYTKQGNFLESSFSEDFLSRNWQLASIEIDPKIAAKSDSVGVSLAVASNTGTFSADFDQAQVFVCK